MRLTKEYHDLEKILNTAEKYKMLLAGIEEAKKVIASEDDEELREMAREELERDSAMIPDVEMEIKRCFLCLPIPRMQKCGCGD